MVSRSGRKNVEIFLSKKNFPVSRKSGLKFECLSAFWNQNSKNFKKKVLKSFFITFLSFILQLLSSKNLFLKLLILL